jgi:hypothetical protein
MAAWSKYDDQQRHEAVAQYLLLRSVKAVASATGIRVVLVGLAFRLK